MSVGAAIRIDSPDQARVIRHAAAFAAREQLPCFVIAVVDALPYGRDVVGSRDAIVGNLALIEQLQATPVMQEGDDDALTLLVTARGFGVKTLFLQSGTPGLLGRSIAERLLYLDPPFDVVVVRSDDTDDG